MIIIVASGGQGPSAAGAGASGDDGLSSDSHGRAGRSTSNKTTELALWWSQSCQCSKDGRCWTAGRLDVRIAGRSGKWGGRLRVPVWGVEVNCRRSVLRSVRGVLQLHGAAAVRQSCRQTSPRSTIWRRRSRNYLLQSVPTSQGGSIRQRLFGFPTI